jgi:glucokinase
MIQLSMKIVLAGDVGGTTTRLGTFDLSGTRPQRLAFQTYGTRDFAGIAKMATTFLRDEGIDPLLIASACFGAAGPIKNGVAQLTNAPVRVDAAEIAQAIGVASVTLLNDLEALAYAVPVLANDEVLVLQAGRADPEGPVAVIAAGTGLGEAVLYRDRKFGDRPVVKASEAGTADFAARTEKEILVMRALTWAHGRAAVEQVISGPGLANIHRALHAARCDAVIDFDRPDAPEMISTSALAGQCKDCVEALDLFIEAYGAEAGNLALRTVATGGVYIGGGIAPKILPALTTGRFMSAFLAKPPFTPMLEAMPVNVILNAEAALLGAANFCSPT